MRAGPKLIAPLFPYKYFANFSDGKKSTWIFNFLTIDAANEYVIISVN